MKLIPVLTEKGMTLARNGKYTFWVLPGYGKDELRAEVEKTFGVHVLEIRTLNYKINQKRNFRGQTVTTPAKKKFIVKLKEKEKIDLFETEKK